MKFAIRECGKGPVIAGLAAVSPDNAILQRLVTDKPIRSLAVNESTLGRGGKSKCEIVRVE